MNSDETIKDIKKINGLLKQLVIEGIRKIFWDEKMAADQYLNIVTKKRTIRIGANDCGVWENHEKDIS